MALRQAVEDDDDLGLKVGAPYFEGHGVVAVIDRTSRSLMLFEVSPILGIPVGSVEIPPADAASKNLAGLFGMAPPAQAETGFPTSWRGEGFVIRLGTGGQPTLELSDDEAPNVLSTIFGGG